MKKMTLIATGDAFITRRFPEGGYEGFEQVRDVISQYDVKFSFSESYFSAAVLFCFPCGTPLFNFLFRSPPQVSEAFLPYPASLCQ